MGTAGLCQPHLLGISLSQYFQGRAITRIVTDHLLVLKQLCPKPTPLTLGSHYVTGYIWAYEALCKPEGAVWFDLLHRASQIILSPAVSINVIIQS